MNTEYNDKRQNGKGLLVASMLLGAGLLASTLLGAQFFSPNASAQEAIDGNGNATSVSQINGIERTTVSTSGSATTKVQPDKVSITVGVETNGTTAQEASSKNANKTADILGALIDLGIPEEQISTSNYNVHPIYSQEQPTSEQQSEVCIMIYPPPPECLPKQNIIGYVASSSLTVTLDIGGEVEGGEVIDTAIEAGANTVNGVYFFISTERQEEIREGLIRDAIENARNRADVAANAVGMEVSGVRAINLNDVYFPIFSSAYDASLREGALAAEASAPTQLMPGEQEVTMTVSVIYYMS